MQQLLLDQLGLGPATTAPAVQPLTPDVTTRSIPVSTLHGPLGNLPASTHTCSRASSSHSATDHTANGFRLLLNVVSSILRLNDYKQNATVNLSV